MNPHFILQNVELLTSDQGEDNNAKVEHLFLFIRLKRCTYSGLGSACTKALNCLLISIQAPVGSRDTSVQRRTRCLWIRLWIYKTPQRSSRQIRDVQNEPESRFCPHRKMASNEVILPLPPPPPPHPPKVYVIIKKNVKPLCS